MKVCIVIPVYNESQNLGSLLVKLKGQKPDVLVVDDGSSDGCSDIAKKYTGTVIRNDAQQGKGYSLKVGFNYALQKGYDGVLTMDGDGQHEPDDIPKFLKEAARLKSCIVNGNRMESAKNMPFIRLLTNRFMSFMISSVCRQKIPDTQCGYRYISADVLQALVFESNGFEIETEILIKASKKGFTIVSVPIRTIYQGEVSHIHPIRDTIRFFSYFFKEIRSSKKQ